MHICKWFLFFFSLLCLSFSRYSESVMNSYPSMGSASSIAQFYHQAAAVSAAGGVGMDSLGSACSQLSSGALSSVGTGQALSEITRHPWLVPTGKSTLCHTTMSPDCSDSHSSI